jgi:hypothetical protein
MSRSMAAVGVAGLLLAGCQANPRYYYTDQDCLSRQTGSRVLAAAAGIGLGIAGVPGGGLVGMGVGLATNPQCQAYHLTPEGRERLRHDIERDRALRAIPVDTRERPYQPLPPPASGRPLDNIPSSTPTPTSPN